MRWDGEWIGEEIKSGRKLLRDDGGLDQGIHWRERGGRKWVLSGYVLKAESTEFADELDVLCRTKRRVKDMDFPLLLDAISQPARPVMANP